jgi:hypothetical protein
MPGEGPGQLFGQREHALRERVGDDIGGVAVGERDQHHEAGPALHQGGDGVHAFAHQQVAFEVPGTARSLASAGRSRMLMLPPSCPCPLMVL